MKRIPLILFISLITLFFSCKRTDRDLEEEEPRTTDLEITVVDELGDRLRGAEVSIYQTNADYAQDRNRIDTKFTNSEGVVLFKNLRTINYYFDIYYEPNNLSNRFDFSTIRTEAPLSFGLLNPMTIRLD